MYGRLWTGLIQLRMEKKLPDSCRHGGEHPGLIEEGNFLAQLSATQLDLFPMELLMSEIHVPESLKRNAFINSVVECYQLDWSTSSESLTLLRILSSLSAFHVLCLVTCYGVMSGFVGSPQRS